MTSQQQPHSIPLGSTVLVTGDLWEGMIGTVVGVGVNGYLAVRPNDTTGRSIRSIAPEFVSVLCDCGKGDWCPAYGVESRSSERTALVEALHQRDQARADLSKARSLNSMSLQERAQVFFDGDRAAMTITFTIADGVDALFARGKGDLAFLVELGSPDVLMRNAELVAQVAEYAHHGKNDAFVIDWPYGPTTTRAITQAFGLDK